MEIDVRAAKPAVWGDVASVLDRRGSVRGCWCMFFRQTAAEYRAGLGAGNRDALRELVAAGGASPGLVAYRDGVPAGWVSVGPRAAYPRLDRSPVSKPVDDTPVWSLVCLYVAPEHRRAGVSRALVRAALRYAAEHGASTVEAYPVDDTLGKVSSDDAYHGVVSLLASEGFAEVARRTPGRPVMRCEV
ncbi:MAG: GNAT family N-acetyltransferase [Micromonosporaceae bacterium]